MNSYIFAETTKVGLQSFYLEQKGIKYFLFNQKLYKGVKNYYTNKMLFFTAVDKSKANMDFALLRTMSKIPMYIKYAEKEYGIVVLRKTQNKNNHIKRKNRSFNTNDYLSVV